MDEAMNKAVDAQFRVWRDRAEAAEAILKEIAEMPLALDLEKDERGRIKVNASFQTDVGLKDKFVVFEFDPAELDLANNFNHIAIQTSASNAGNITEAFMEALGRYQGAAPPASEV